MRWLCGTILTGLAGCVLIGGAIMAATNRGPQTGPATGAAKSTLALAPGGDRHSNSTRKSDRIVTTDRTVNESRHTFKVTTVTRVGEREVVRTRPVTRISASLGAPVAASLKIPAFNPLSIMVDNGGAKPEDVGPAPDGDVSYVVLDLDTVPVRADDGPSVALSDVLTKVRETAAFTALNDSVRRTAFTGTGPVLALAGPTRSISLPSATVRGTLAPFASGGLPIVPGMTVMTKTLPTQEPVPAATAAAGAGPAETERMVVIRAGDRIGDLLQEAGASAESAAAIVTALGSIRASAGQRLRIVFAVGSGKGQPLRVSLLSGEHTETTVVLSDTGGYAAVAGPLEIAQEAEDEEDEEAPVAGRRPRLYESLYATAMAKGMPKPVLDEVIRVFGHDADFQRRVDGADGFEVLYASDEDGNVEGSRPELLFSSLMVGGETRRYYRFQVPGGDGADYFDEEGRSVRKFLVRKPLSGGTVTRGFGMMRHPILGYSKMHTGVDWGAPRGSPIYAAGNGVVTKADWDGGYGRRVQIRHTNGYETSYGHMSAFARGIQSGTRVRQGQLIGYVGSTGLSTGPHLHYEIAVNGRFVNPLRIRVPRERELDGEQMAAFRQERERIDQLVGRGVNSAGIAVTNRSGG